LSVNVSEMEQELQEEENGEDVHPED